MKSQENLRVMSLGDIVGREGRQAIADLVPQLKEQYQIDFVIANGENAAGGVGLNAKTALELFKGGIDVITLGDHAFQHKDFFDYLNKHPENCIRPLNFPKGCPGQGWTTINFQGISIGILNVIGRTFMSINADCPFSKTEEILNDKLSDCKICICDIHAEATSEKIAFARNFDGKFSLIFGTHTHVQTSDERISNKGTAFITDLGMCGSSNGVIGMASETAISRFTSGIQYSYKIAHGDAQLHGVICDIHRETGKAIHIERIVVDHKIISSL